MLTNTTNTRELGGYCSKDGRITKYKSFLRSDEVSQCNEGDIAKLKDYGV
ncbi:MAG: tyrosine-protein phosphatase, partial [Sporomusa sp.]